MNAHIYSKIHNITKYLREIHFSIILFRFCFYIYKCLLLPYSNTMIITQYHLSRENSNNIVELRFSICLYLDFEFTTVIFMKWRCYDRYLQYIELRSTQKSRCEKSLELTLKKLNVSTAKWGHFFYHGGTLPTKFLGRYFTL